MQVIKYGTKRRTCGDKDWTRCSGSCVRNIWVMEPTMLQSHAISTCMGHYKDVKTDVNGLRPSSRLIYDNYTKMDIEIAIKYVEYKQNDIARANINCRKNFFLHVSWLSDCMDELGKFVYIRKYIRWPDKNRRETWKETQKARAINLYCSWLTNSWWWTRKIIWIICLILHKRLLVVCYGWCGGTEAPKRLISGI